MIFTPDTPQQIFIDHLRETNEALDKTEALALKSMDDKANSPRPKPETPKNKHAMALGRLGGVKRSSAKTKAARKNGKLGGRPRKVLESS